MKVCLGFGVRDVPVGLKQTPVIEPDDPFGGCVFDSFKAAPRAGTVGDPGFEQAVDRLGQRVAIAVADAADQRSDAGF